MGVTPGRMKHKRLLLLDLVTVIMICLLGWMLCYVVLSIRVQHLGYGCLSGVL